MDPDEEQEQEQDRYQDEGVATVDRRATAGWIDGAVAPASLASLASHPVAVDAIEAVDPGLTWSDHQDLEEHRQQRMRRTASQEALPPAQPQPDTPRPPADLLPAASAPPTARARAANETIPEDDELQSVCGTEHEEAVPRTPRWAPPPPAPRVPPLPRPAEQAFQLGEPPDGGSTRPSRRGQRPRSSAHDPVEAIYLVEEALDDVQRAREEAARAAAAAEARREPDAALRPLARLEDEEEEEEEEDELIKTAMARRQAAAAAAAAQAPAAPPPQWMDRWREEPESPPPPSPPPPEAPPPQPPAASPPPALLPKSRAGRPSSAQRLPSGRSVSQRAPEGLHAAHAELERRREFLLGLEASDLEAIMSYLQGGDAPGPRPPSGPPSPLVRRASHASTGSLASLERALVSG